MLSNFSKKNYPILCPVPSGTTYVLVFDVETTGLLPKSDPITKQLPPIETYPYITQISWVLYNMKTNMFDDVKNYIIKVPDFVEISPQITELTGITREMCDKGREIPDVLFQFYELYVNADMVVAHNIQFDATMVNMEMMRHCAYLETRLGRDFTPNIFSDEFTSSHKLNLYCTMVASKDVCNIMVESKPKTPFEPIKPMEIPTTTPMPRINDEPSVYGSTEELVVIPRKAAASPPRIVSLPKPEIPPRKYKKYPKLCELHEHLFGSVPENLHNALVDTLVCLRCFLMIRCGYHMSSRKFALILQRYVS